jgi:CRISPR/Cas system-associated exonuclease Cas4 (RecB family)
MTQTSLSNLVPDIYKTIDEGIELSTTERAELGEQLVSAVLQGLGKNEEQKGGELRMSNFGTPCERKLWYTVNKPEWAEKLEPWARFKFAYGHLLETVVLFLTKKAGHEVKGEQTELDFHGIKGHRDAIIDGVVVDVKSANSRGMGKFKDHALESDDPFAYLDQLSLYAAASKGDPNVAVTKEAAFLAVDKELGHIVLDKYKVKEIDEATIEAKKQMLSSSTPPRRAYLPQADGKSGNQKLGVACSYCPYKQQCWADANKGRGLRGFLYSNGPRWLTWVEREPEVSEISKEA